MARRFGFAALLLAAIGVGGCAATREQFLGHHPYDEDISSFYDDLASYGTWVEVDPYGWVWCPDDVPSAWQPYTVGSWIYTDDGWFWFAEDPWGSVPYHYGRWTIDHHHGWVWVPGYVWAPAWVAWRYGSGWVGWAPLPPDVSWEIHVGIVFSSFELDHHIDRHHWAFTRAQDFGTHRTRIRVERPDRNEKLLKETRNITRYAAGPRPVEEGMRPDLIQEIRGKKIERYRIVDSAKPVSKGGVTVRGGKAEVYRPTVDAKKMVRERVGATPPEKRPEPASPAVERVERTREEPETRVLAERDRVPRERSQGSMEVRAQNGGERQKPIANEPEGRIETKREEVTRPRQDEARERQEEARERRKEGRERAVDAEDSKEGSRVREREVRGSGRERESEATKPEAREHQEAARERKGESKERPRGR